MGRKRWVAFFALLTAGVIVLSGCGGSSNEVTNPLAGMKMNATVSITAVEVVVDKQTHDCWLDIEPGKDFVEPTNPTATITRLADGYYLHILDERTRFFVSNSTFNSASGAYGLIKNCSNPDSMQPSGTRLAERYRLHIVGTDLAKDGSGWIFDDSTSPPLVWIPMGARTTCFIDPGSFMEQDNEVASPANPSIHIHWDGHQGVIDTLHQGTEELLEFLKVSHEGWLPATCPPPLK